MTVQWTDQSKAPPKIIDGVTFTCWRTFDGYISRYKWRSDDGRCVAWSPTHADTHRAAVDGGAIGKKFRSLENAMRAAVKAAKAEGSPDRGG